MAIMAIGPEAFEQRTIEWKEARLGRITATQARRLRPKRTKEAVWSKLALELAAESLCGAVYDRFSGYAARRGAELEEEALREIAFALGVEIDPLPGLVVHPDLQRCACSPDAFISDGKGMIQAKCPEVPANHLACRISPDEDYIEQCQYELWVCQREYSYLASYHPDFPPSTQVLWHLVKADPAIWAEYEAGAREVLAMSNAILDEVTT